jgi:hypothetical protein
LACAEAAAPGTTGSSFTFAISIGSPPAQVATGDSAYWELFPATRQGPLFSAFLTSPDSLGASPPPTNFYLTQVSPVFQNGSLAAGSYNLTPIDSTVMTFGLSYPDVVNGAHSAVSDSGLLTVTPPAGDSIIHGSVSAWMHEYRPAVGPPFQVTGHFTIVPRH